MIKVSLLDGSVRYVSEGSTILDLAASVAEGLARKAVAGKINGELKDLDFPLMYPCSQAGESVSTELPLAVEIVTVDSEDGVGLEILRHSTSHLMAQAVQNLFPGTQLAIGPPIANGFYYDFDSDHVFVPEDLAAIEAEMKRLASEDLPIRREELSREEALTLFREREEPYKVELINDLPAGVVISVYHQGAFVDLCAGPHVPSTKRLKVFKLQTVAGAYWRGDEKNKMLQRIYGLAFAKESDLSTYLFRLEEAKRRDHRKLGTELDLFSLHEDGPGFPFFHPKGMILRGLLEDFWRREHVKRGYQEIKTPIILSRSLWEHSGHWDHYKDNMYFTQIDDRDFAIKPMNCPGGMIIFKSKIRSYRDLPLRFGELGLVHRHELSGVLHGLLRVRNFTQDDAHIYMTPEQITGEIIGVIELIDYFYKVFGFEYHVELSTRPENSMGSDETWDMATEALQKALINKGLKYKINAGDGAFYGPKIDFHVKDSLERTWQCGTIQLDFLMPEKFDLSYIGEDAEKHRPVMIHRVVYGSLERFMALLIEHYAGAFPTWLAPVQVRVLPISDRHHDYGAEVATRLRETGVRAEVDRRREKINYKIRETQTEKIPFALIVGDREVEESRVTMRRYGEADSVSVSLEAFQHLLDSEKPPGTVGRPEPQLTD
ncbi:MAG: threonine--tRNA ligase [Gracilibacteraceae bacterium]|jgi:threonyl-tRNA synthetase|nr:threonine--tRNA ligase [Gracilibacteraceae bacterium]